MVVVVEPSALVAVELDAPSAAVPSRLASGSAWLDCDWSAKPAWRWWCPWAPLPWVAAANSPGSIDPSPLVSIRPNSASAAPVLPFVPKAASNSDLLMAPSPLASRLENRADWSGVSAAVPVVPVASVVAVVPAALVGLVCWLWFQIRNPSTFGLSELCPLVPVGGGANGGAFAAASGPLVAPGANWPAPIPPAAAPEFASCCACSDDRTSHALLATPPRPSMPRSCKRSRLRSTQQIACHGSKADVRAQSDVCGAGRDGRNCTTQAGGGRNCRPASAARHTGANHDLHANSRIAQGCR